MVHQQYWHFYCWVLFLWYFKFKNTDSLLTCFITVCYSASAAKDRCRLQVVIDTAEKVPCWNIPSLKICTRPAQLGPKPCEAGYSWLLPPWTKTSQHKNSFFLTAVRLIHKTTVSPLTHTLASQLTTIELHVSSLQPLCSPAVNIYNFCLFMTFYFLILHLLCSQTQQDRFACENLFSIKHSSYSV